MTVFKRVLVATDFDEPASCAVDVAVTLASTFEAELLLFHAYWFPPIGYATYAEGLCWPTADISAQDAKVFDALVAKVKLRYPRTEGILVDGEPWGAILQAVKDRGADLIILGTHGRRGLSRVFLGSVAEKIVRLSPVPVLTIPGRVDSEANARAIPPVSG